MLLTFDESVPLPEGMHQGRISDIGLLQENGRCLSMTINLPDDSVYRGLLPAKLYPDHPLLVLWKETFPTAKPGKMDTDALIGLAVQFRLETVFSGNRAYLNIAELHHLEPGDTLENINDGGNIDF